MSSLFPISLSLAWLAGAEPALLTHAYTDQARYASLGLSVGAAAMVVGSALSVTSALLLSAWAGYLLFPAATAAAAFGLHVAFRWASAGPRLGRRLSALALGLVLVAALIEWPLGTALLYSANVASIASSSALVTLHWALRGMLALILLVPLYVLAAAQSGSYALAIAKRNELNGFLYK